MDLGGGGVCVCDVRAWRVYFWSSALVIGPGVAVQATGRPLVRTVRKQGSFSQMTPLPPSPSSLIPTFRPRLRLLSTSSISWGPLGDGGGEGGGDASRTGEDKLQPQSLGYLPCFHLHQQLISHHWRALARQAEDFIRDVLYGH